VLADFREPESIRIGMSPLSTSFAEAHRGLTVLAALLAEAVA
jgi:kynureninase